jgi:hypothetical protein
MKRAAIAAFALAAIACAERTTNVTAPIASASPSATAKAIAPPIAKAAPACAIAPLELVLREQGGTMRVVLSLDASGAVAASMMGPPKAIARLDARGCLVSTDGVEVDATSAGALWTPHERFDFASGRLRLEGGRSMIIDESGEVVTFARDGSAEPSTYGGFAFRGYSARSACAARVLLVMFLSMMPSMAVSDGHPRVLPVPEDSACPELPHAGTK